MIKLKTIRINEGNPRQIQKDKIQQLKKSIKEFEIMMELRPIIIDESSIILGGNMRYLALKELGYTEVPNTWVKQAKDLTAEQKKEFIIKDNLPYGDWDWDILANEFDTDELLDWGLDLDIPQLQNDDKEIEELETENECPKCGYKW